MRFETVPIGAVLLGLAAAAPSPARAQGLGERVYAEHCAECHDAPASRAPTRADLSAMSAARIVRSMDFGTMMSVTYMLDRTEREAVAGFLGVPGEQREPPPEAYCDDAAVVLPAPDVWDWNGWSPAPTNTRYQNDPGLASVDVGRLELEWAFAFDGDVNAFAPPAVLGDALFVGSAGGSVYALDAKTGCIKWHYQADGPVRTAIVVAPLAEGGELAAAESGSASSDLQRRTPPPPQAPRRQAGPFAAGGGQPGAIGAAAAPGVDAPAPVVPAAHALLFGDQTGGFYAVGAENGQLLWKRRPEIHEATKLTGAALAHDGVVYVPVASWEESRPLNPQYECCTFRGSIAAYRIADGEPLWKSLLVREAPRIIGTTEGGVPMWGPSGAGTWSAPTLDEKRGLLYVTTGNNYTGMTEHSDAVVAIWLEDGQIAWSNQLTPGDEFNLYCRNRPEGCPGMDFDIGASAMLATLPDGSDMLIVGQKSGVVYALDPDDAGRVLWQARVGAGGINGGVLWGMASDGNLAYAAVSDLARRERSDGNSFDPRPAGVDPTAGGGLTALDLATGETFWYAPPTPCSIDRPVCSPAQPAAVSAMPGAVFSGAVDGYLRAFSTRDGALIWSFDTARPFETVNGIPGRGGSIDGDGAVIAGGMVYVTSGYGRNGGIPGNVLLAFRPR